jgi:hypothetical protein
VGCNDALQALFKQSEENPAVSNSFHVRWASLRRDGFCWEQANTQRHWPSCVRWSDTLVQSQTCRSKRHSTLLQHRQHRNAATKLRLHGES